MGVGVGLLRFSDGVFSLDFIETEGERAQELVSARGLIPLKSPSKIDGHLPKRTIRILILSISSSLVSFLVGAAGVFVR